MFDKLIKRRKLTSLLYDNYSDTPHNYDKLNPIYFIVQAHKYIGFTYL